MCCITCRPITLKKLKAVFMIHGVLMLSKDFEDPGEGRGVQKLRASLCFKEFCDFIFGCLLRNQIQKSGDFC